MSASVFDVARYILKKKGSLTTIKLQKLVYYCQAWSLVWDEKPLFTQKIEAWANGPVVPALFQEHKGRYSVPKNGISGDVRRLSQDQKDTIDGVLSHYGAFTASDLVQLTHSEEPWLSARKGHSPGSNCSVEIKRANIAEYYSGLLD
jgi:uncharacterized phage-associated protein